MVAKRIHLKRSGKKIVVIPARMSSGRLPGKPMLEAAGKPLVQWTYEQAKKTEADHVIVATGDVEIAQHCDRVGMTWMLADGNHPNGTSRVAEVVAKLKLEVRQGNLIIVNWQVDEPMVETSDVNKLMALRLTSIGTLVCKNRKTPSDVNNMLDPNTVKVVWSRGQCHWFSRASIPGAGFHIGLYSFSVFLLGMASRLNPSHLSELESLEQLTWLENDISLVPIEIEQSFPLSINTLKDWAVFKQLKEAGE